MLLRLLVRLRVLLVVILTGIPVALKLERPKNTPRPGRFLQTLQDPSAPRHTAAQPLGGSQRTRPFSAWGDTKEKCEMQRPKVSVTYLLLCKLALEVLVEQAFVEELREGMTFDMARKVKMSVRLLNPPFLLQLGGCVSII